MYHVRITVQTRALPEMNQECITSCHPRFVKIGMVFQFVIWRVFVDSFVTSTRCVAPVLEGVKSVQRCCRMSTLRLPIALGQQMSSTGTEATRNQTLSQTQKMNRISGGRKHHHTHERRKGGSFAVRKGITAAPSPKNNVGKQHIHKGGGGTRGEHDSLFTNAFWLFLSQILRVSSSTLPLILASGKIC